MRRGFEFENELNKLSKYLNSIGIHMHKNHAKRTESGVYLEGEPFDYEILKGGELHVFDAKECSSAHWNLSNAKLSQLNNMLVCHKNGAQAYFLVWFKLSNKIVRFDAELVRQALVDGKKSLREEDGQLWQWTELATSKTNTAS